ncbi:GNAT family N-acetyltransferase [Streptomyces sp. NPDC053705]|uniref:GNAT family N-acetyltransferase n=1 Tax=Streptomyces sp. NPDC053705 TaxID=3156668 RepID=UPI003445CC27
MFELKPSGLPPLDHWFPVGAFGVSALAEHALVARTGRWWADRPVAPRVMAVECGGRVLLRGDPRALRPDGLASLLTPCLDAPASFLPALRASFPQLEHAQNMVYVHGAPSLPAHPPRGVLVRRLTPEDAAMLADLPAEASWIHATWGGPDGLAASGTAWGAVRRGRLLGLACTHILGSRYEDVAVVAGPGPRGEHVTLACVDALCRDIAGRGHTPSWSCRREDRTQRLLAWQAGFRIARECAHYTIERIARDTAPVRAAVRA